MPDHNSYPCPACHGTNQKILGAVAGHKALLCSSCGLAFMDLRAAPVYDHSDWYTWLQHSPQYGEVCLKSYSHCRAEVSSLAKLTTARTLVDIGAGPGFFARQAADLGWSVTCVEVNSVARKFGSEIYGLTYRGLEELDTASSDVVRVSHLLEHVPDPLPLLAEIKRVLKKNGLATVVVPHYEPLDCVIKNLILKCVPGKHDFRAVIYAPQHVLGFSPSTLTAMLSRAGFHPITVRCVSRGNKTYYPWRFEGAWPTPKKAVFEIVNGFGNMFGRGGWIVGHFRA